MEGVLGSDCSWPVTGESLHIEVMFWTYYRNTGMVPFFVGCLSIFKVGKPGLWRFKNSRYQLFYYFTDVIVATIFIQRRKLSLENCYI